VLAVLILVLTGIAVSGGIFVVPLYAFLTTTVSSDQTSRTVAASEPVRSSSWMISILS